MSDQPIHPDSVELTKDEATTTFTTYWTENRFRDAKVLAKQLMHTSFDAIEVDGLRAERHPNHTVIVKPASDDRPNYGLPEPELPTLHLNMGTPVEDCIRVFKRTDSKHYPEEK